ncbi:MAG: YheV family putative zinc ribbon protein [Plesiomonas sp.]|uniref:YheV family putative zinc ribbon protein n=1 Tax=Plesiomonas sp. TaxID=2486279 RepID=UPI003F35625B
MNKRRRFIAAAKCPQCQAIDTLALYQQDQVEVVECVQCGHRQTQAQQHIEKEKRRNEQVIGVFHPD